jgi:hypothetical protein
MIVKITTYILPAHWASALVNNDRSGLSDLEEQELDMWLEDTDPGYCVSVSDEEYFAHMNDANALPCSVLEFTFHK